MVYERQPGWKQADFQGARELEEQVGTWLNVPSIPNLTATDKLDYFVPGYWLEIKEKRQKLTERWHLLPGVAGDDLFVLDELSIRKAALHAPSAYFLFRDLPLQRFFLARVDEVFCADRIRRQRGGKGKWILDLSAFRQVNPPDEDLNLIIMEDQVSLGWKQSGCISKREISQI